MVGVSNDVDVSVVQPESYILTGLYSDWFIFVSLICILIGASGNAVEYVPKIFSYLGRCFDSGLKLRPIQSPPADLNHRVHHGFGRPEHYLTEHQVRYFTAWTYGEWIQTMLVSSVMTTDWAQRTQLTDIYP